MEIQNAKTVIKTEKSSLLLIKHNYRQLIKKIIEEIDEKLNERPEIIVFGKKCNQNRNVGFFSNNSIGYNYSNKLERSKPLTPNLILLLNNVNMQFNSDFNGILINEYINVQYDLNVTICLKNYIPKWNYFMNNTIKYDKLDSLINKKIHTKDKLLKIYEQFNHDFI